MNIGVYYNETPLNLSLIAIHGNCAAEKLLALLQKILETFELKLEADVVATTGDGAAAVEKFRKLSPTIQQLC
jgi:hypothetical protein